MRFAIVSLLFGLALPAAAACPPAPDHAAALDELVAQANAAETEHAGREIGNRMWELWADAPDEQAQAILDRGMAMRESYNYEGARQEFERLVTYCPDYAEGYNQRAFIAFLTGRFDAAVPDLERALDLSPGHVAARAGLALTYMQLGDLAAARRELEAALKLNPWLSERHLLAKGAPLAPKGEDI